MLPDQTAEMTPLDNEAAGKVPSNGEVVVLIGAPAITAFGQISNCTPPPAIAVSVNITVIIAEDKKV